MKHHIIVKWNETVNDKPAMIPNIKALFEKALSIEGIEQVDLIPNIIDRPNRYDLMIVITMDENALSAYDESIYHKEWKEKYGSFIESKCIFDSLS